MFFDRIGYDMILCHIMSYRILISYYYIQYIVYDVNDLDIILIIYDIDIILIINDIGVILIIYNYFHNC